MTPVERPADGEVRFLAVSIRAWHEDGRPTHRIIGARAWSACRRAVGRRTPRRRAARRAARRVARGAAEPAPSRSTRGRGDGLAASELRAILACARGCA